MPHLTKSKYLAGRQCSKRVWLACLAPKLASPPDLAQQAIFDTGTEVGRRAQLLFPGGVVVDERPAEHAEAMRRTRALMAAPEVPAIFEAAFEHENVRVRVDVLERLAGGAWGLREVKASAGPKATHLDDLAVQTFVLRGAGLVVPSLELIHIDRRYVRDEVGIEWDRFFARADLTGEIEAVLGEVPARVREMHTVLSRDDPPEVEPWRHCTKPYPCAFWAHCTQAKPKDWIYRLPRLRGARCEALRQAGIESITRIPDDFSLTPVQARVREACISGVPFVDSGLAEALAGSGPPAFYLDFETIAPAIPAYPGTRPFEGLPVQWSLHHLDPDGVLSHQEFLAAGSEDPRPELAERLVSALGNDDTPILVYSGFEAGILRHLARCFPELARELEAVRKRLFDLLPVVRRSVYHPDFAGSYSIKHVAPALAPGISYAELDGIAEGQAAAAAFAQIANGMLSPDNEARVRRELLLYCKLDTESLVALQAALFALTGG